MTLRRIGEFYASAGALNFARRSQTSRYVPRRFGSITVWFNRNSVLLIYQYNNFNKNNKINNRFKQTNLNQTFYHFQRIQYL